MREEAHVDARPSAFCRQLCPMSPARLRSWVAPLKQPYTPDKINVVLGT
jgi:hypothetical protein